MQWWTVSSFTWVKYFPRIVTGTGGCGCRHKSPFVLSECSLGFLVSSRGTCPGVPQVLWTGAAVSWVSSEHRSCAGESWALHCIAVVFARQLLLLCSIWRCSVILVIVLGMKLSHCRVITLQSYSKYFSSSPYSFLEVLYTDFLMALSQLQCTQCATAANLEVKCRICFEYNLHVCPLD